MFILGTYTYYIIYCNNLNLIIFLHYRNVTSFDNLDIGIYKTINLESNTNETFKDD